MEAKSCPMCKGSVVLAGSVMAGFATPLSFVPHGVRPSLSEQGVPMTWVACLSCGHAWLQVAPQDLRACVASRGTELLKQRLARLDHGPHHDLPDLPGAIQAADWVAEIDESDPGREAGGGDPALSRALRQDVGRGPRNDAQVARSQACGETRPAPPAVRREAQACRDGRGKPSDGRSLAGSTRTRAITREGSIGFSELQSRPVTGGFHPRGPAPGSRIGSSRKRRAGKSRRKVRALPEPRRGSVRGTGPPRGHERDQAARRMRNRPA